MSITSNTKQSQPMYYFVSEYNITLPQECQMISSSNITDILESPNLPGGFAPHEIIFQEKETHGVVYAKLNNETGVVGHVYTDFDVALEEYKKNIEFIKTLTSIEGE